MSEAFDGNLGWRLDADPARLARCGVPLPRRQSSSGA
jgi:hypothetical protein